MKFITLKVYCSQTHVFDNTLCRCNGSIFIASLSYRGVLYGADRFSNKYRLVQIQRFHADSKRIQKFLFIES